MLHLKTRRIKNAFSRVFGNSFSHTTVSAILQKLQQKLDIWRNTKIEKQYFAIVLDGIWLNLRTVPKYIKNLNKKTTKGVILTVMGITEDRKKEIIGFKFAYSESTENLLRITFRPYPAWFKTSKSSCS